jgi:hypothetical protein
MCRAFDYARFFEQGDAYVRMLYPKEVAEWYLKRSNLLAVRRLVPNFLKLVEVEQRTASLQEVEELVRDGWLAVLDVNSCVLNGRDGFDSHSVVVFDLVEDEFV